MYGVDTVESDIHAPQERRGLTFMMGVGGSATVSIFGTSKGREASLALAITSGREGLDAGVVVVIGKPIDEFWLTANVGVDAFVGGVAADFQGLEGKGQAVNVIVGPAAAAGLAHHDGSDIPGGIIGINASPPPLYLGFSVTETSTRIWSYRGAVDTVAGWVCRLSSRCIP
jgi:hypothetical protein